MSTTGGGAARLRSDRVVVTWLEDDGGREYHVARDSAETTRTRCGRRLPYWSKPRREMERTDDRVCGECRE